jgi:hypothetical protein
MANIGPNVADEEARLVRVISHHTGKLTAR